MFSREFHPKTGLHYICVVPFDNGVPVTDVSHSYAEFATRHQWITVVDVNVFVDLINNHGWNEPNYFVLSWNIFRPTDKKHRRYLFAPVYVECFGDIQLSEHYLYLNEFIKQSKQFDAVFGHTPYMVDSIHDVSNIPSYLLPLGWNPNVVGRPKFNIIKQYNIVYYGTATITGQIDRWKNFKAIEKSLASDIVCINGNYGKDLVDELQKARCSLYIQHTDMKSFSSWRTWQSIASSCAMCFYPTDPWPLLPEHYVPVPKVTIDNINEVTTLMRNILKNIDLLSVARLAHNDIGPEYTIDKCIENFLIPASEVMLKNKNNDY